MFTGRDTGSVVVKDDIAHVYRQCGSKRWHCICLQAEIQAVWWYGLAHVYRQRYRQSDGKRWHCTCLQAEIQEVSDQMRQLMKDINAINQQGCGVSAEVGNLRREIQGWFGNKCRFHCLGYFLMFKWANGGIHLWFDSVKCVLYTFQKQYTENKSGTML